MPLYPKHSDIFCGNCTHFSRHYVKDKGRYMPLTFGHCTHLRVKEREEGQTCPNWQPRKQA